MNHFLLLGNHLELALAEAKAVMGGEKPMLCEHLALFNRKEWNDARLQEQLAGTIKLGEIIATFKLSDCTPEAIAELILDRPRANKIQFGLTLFGSASLCKRFKNLPIQIKKVLKEAEHPVRWVTGDQGEISPAAVAKLKLTTEGYDLCIALTSEKAYIGLTTQVQDADAWSLRDYGRPNRDTLNGMMPPKLARMMVNLGVGSSSSKTLLDPFCGGGTTLMEAAMLHTHLQLTGSDISPKQMEDTIANLDWLVKEKLLLVSQRIHIKLLVGEAQTLDQKIPHDSIETIVTEGYLGQPLRGYESQRELEENAKTIEGIWKEAFAALAKIQKADGILVTICPDFHTQNGHARVHLRGLAEENGYTQLDPLTGWQTPTLELPYARPDQRVKRLIVVFKKR